MPVQQQREGAGRTAVLDRETARNDESATERLPSATLEVALLTGGQDRHYAVGLATALVKREIRLDVIGSDEVDGPEFHGDSRMRFLNLHGGQINSGVSPRIGRILAFYVRLFWYALTAKPKVFHILWNNKLQLLDRTVVMLLYKATGKKLVFTAHNVNAGRRDKKDSWMNRITLRCQYRICDHIFVHTKKMSDELIAQFEVKADKITIIPYGINNAVPVTALTCAQAREALGIEKNEKVILYFGAIKEYKGLEYLVAAFQQIADAGNFRLIIAGERKKGYEAYWDSIREMIEAHPSRDKVLQNIQFIPDTETEIYFKAADVAVLSYTEIFQSGILFMAFAYGLPVIASDVGSFADDIEEGKTGLICKARDPEDLATQIRRYFETELYRDLEDRRREIQDCVLSRHSWEVVAAYTRSVYSGLLKQPL